MKRWIAPLAIGMVLLYASLAIGAANCLILHAEQPAAHHHNSHSHVAHSALCAWACQINPAVTVPAAVPVVAVTIVITRLSLSDSTAGTAFPCSLFSSRAPPLI
jgi:hypothetical protein